MDAKSKMDFINSVGANINCSSCGEPIQDGDAFCQKCGTSFKNDAPALAKSADVEQIAKDSMPAQAVVYVEPPIAFASGLPDWSIEPPAVVVRRKARI